MGQHEGWPRLLDNDRQHRDGRRLHQGHLRDAVEGPNDIADVTGDIAGYDGIICGAPTWHTGADTERSGTEWDSFIYGDLTSMDLAGKKVAIFGLGDQSGYSDNFCDAMDELKR